MSRSPCRPVPAFETLGERLSVSARSGIPDVRVGERPALQPAVHLPGLTVMFALAPPAEDPLVANASTAYVAWEAFEGTVFVIVTDAEDPADSSSGRQIPARGCGRGDDDVGVNAAWRAARRDGPLACGRIGPSSTNQFCR